jgi:hypothetical protein
MALLCLAPPTGYSQFIPEWVRTYSSGPNLSSRAAALALTPEGNIIVAGSADDSDGEPDYLAIKYNVAGDVAWTQHYASPRKKNNQVTSLALDPAGNVILTGSSDTVKLDSSGVRIWSAPFNGQSIAAALNVAYLASLTSTGYTTVQIGNDVPAPVDVILDCDPGGDPDDMSDLAILNNLMTRGEVNVLAVMGAHTGPFIGPQIQIMNRFYGHPNIPFGVTSTGPEIGETYGWYILQRYGNSIGYDPTAPDATTLYRTILTTRPDHSATIIFTGQLRNLLNLWRSTPDNASGLYGPALLEKKIRQLIIVAGVFPDSFGGGEYNMATDTEAALVLNEITNSVPVTFVGIEQGDPILIPSKGIGVMDTNNPVRYAHEIFGVTNRSSWSGLALLLAARGPSWGGQTYFDATSGRVTIAANGADKFVQGTDSNQRFVRKMQADERYIQILDDLLLTAPPNGPAPDIGDRTGREIWHRSFSSGALDVAKSVRLNVDGDVYVGGIEGSSDDPATATGRFVLLRYGEAGSLRWRATSANIVDPPPRQLVDLRAMVVTNNSIYLFGQYGRKGGLFKFSDKGEQLWAYRFQNEATAAQMVVGSSEDIYTAHINGNVIVVARLNSGGELLNETSYALDAQQQIHLEAAIQDGAGNTYFAGGSIDADNHSQIFFLRCNQDLSQLSLTAYPSRYPGDARTTAVAVGSSGDLYLSGYMPTADLGSQMFLLKYTPSFKMQKLESGAIRLQYRIAPNRLLSVEATHDFSQWELIGSVQADGRGVAEFEDTNAVNHTLRFYRTQTH